MENISLYLFGYRRITVGYENLSAVMSLLLKNRIIAYFEIMNPLLSRKAISKDLRSVSVTNLLMNIAIVRDCSVI